ncbi:SDR family oxidoreductase [Arthrobacter sp. OV608]|uniref:SDR family oxidoreductase n=1 Tax=Arthrobacter sp. OV608 TaxID=1882768 RepID=UPI0008C66840|nr:SDR family oxidoreductase [Arthrobacter sp. OV608]SEQ96694.1 NADP-dependent 3-hydroxy acid dehydrogenase YdfG [Arthrobacter sp. OV608]
MERVNSSKTWFITGASRGFGREWATAALERGDRVAATARDSSSLDNLVETFGDAILPIQLDVKDREADFAAVAKAHEHFGVLDVVVNNAGTWHVACIEEISEDEARGQLETNFFGPLWVTQAALPFLREQGGGHIIQVSSLGGVSTFPLFSMYHASKWALEGFSQALADEVAGFGIHVTIIEPGVFLTPGYEAPNPTSAPNPEYDKYREKAAKRRAANQAPLGDAKASAVALLQVVDAQKPPLRVFFGTAPFNLVKSEYAERLATWEKWNHISELAQGNAQG